MEAYPSEESWKIEEYSKYYERNENLRWIWKKRLCLGKKIVLTSIVISSAPILFPPLVAISSFGFVCSLPVGFAIVTYACTEKLINTLLPMPPPPLLSSGRTKSFNEEEHRVVDDVEGYEEDVDMEAEEEEFEEDTRMGVEMRIEFVDEVDNEIDSYEEIPVDMAEGDRSMQESEIVEEDGYEEDDGEYMENEEQHLNSNVIPDILGGIRQAQDEITMVKSGRDEMPSSSLQTVVISAEVGGEDKSNVELVLEEAVILEPENREDENGNTEMFSGINEEEIRSETTGLIEEMRDDSTDQQKNQESEVKRDISIKDVAESSGNRELFVIQEEVKPIEDVDEPINPPAVNDTLNEPLEVESASSHEMETNPVVLKNLAVHVNTLGGHTNTEVRQGGGSDWKRGPLIISNEDVREIADESGFNLFDDDTLESDQTTITVDDQSSEGEPFSDDIINVNIDYHEVLIVSEVSEARDVTTAPKHGIKAGSNKESVSEEKIREQIQAMRTIVGYNERPHPSFTEELKALYMITGIEPPDLSEDLAEVDEKLHFLMSIVGVK